MLAFLAIGFKQAFLGQAALLPERVQLHGVQLCALSGELLLEMPRQREIDIVSTQQDVLAHGDAVQLQIAGLLGNSDQGEVGGATADVDHQNEIAYLNALAPIGMALNPGIESCLGFLQQQQILVAGQLRGIKGQFARDRVERSWDGNKDLLMDERRVRHLRIPGSLLAPARSCPRFREHSAAE